MRMKDNQYQWFRAAAEGIRRLDGSVSRIAGIFINIDAKKKEIMQAQKSAAFHRAFTKADLCEYYVNLEANTFDTFKVEPSLMTVFEQSHTWDELIRHFVDSYVVETDKKAVSSFYDRGYIAERLKGLETELALECRITLNGEERWVRNVVIRGEIEDSEYAMIFLRDITEAKVESARHLQMAADNASMEQLIQSIVRLVDRFVVCDLENDRYEFYNLNGQMIYKPLGFYHDFQMQVLEKYKTLEPLEAIDMLHALFHGDDLTLGQSEPERKTLVDWEPASQEPEFFREICDLPPQETWKNARDYGAYGNGISDDTAALQKALDECDTVYLPQGTYLLSDTLRMREGNSLIGLNPISTQLVLGENSPAWAGMGAPKAVLETSRGGWNLVNGLGIDTASRNPRAVGCKWMASANSYMNDVKFVGGHGQITQQQENVPVYNASRTADVNPDRPWDSQYWSLWITDNGGGAFKDVWTANTYAEAGFFVSETETPGVMYQVSIEHHVRHEVLLRNVANWKFFCMQTEEEVAEGPYCQPYEMTNCHDLLFANFYSFRVIWVDNPYPSVVRAWNCENIEFLNCHNFTQMKYTIENLYVDVNTGKTAGFWQLGRLRIPHMERAKKLPNVKGEIGKIISGLDCVDALCQAPDGAIYICDSRLYRIYRWDPETETMILLTSQHFQPLSLACDSQGRLLVVTEYQPVKNSVVNGIEELVTDEFGGESGGGCYYPFFSYDRRIRVCAIDPKAPEASLELLPVVSLEQVKPDILYYPANQWRDSGDMMESFAKNDIACYLAPDGKTAIVHTPALARACGLTPLCPGKPAYLVDEYNKCIVQVQVGNDFALSNPTVWAERGEYGFAMTEDGDAYIPDCLLYIYVDGEKKDTIQLHDRPACVLEAGKNKEYLYITARRDVYALRLK